MQLLKKSALFKKVPPEELKVLTSLSQRESLNSGSIIFNQDHPAEKIYLLDYGIVAIKTFCSNGLEITYEMITKIGDPFGLSALVAPFRFTTTAICLEKTQVVTFQGKDLMRIFTLYPPLGFKVMQNLCALLARRLERTRQLLAGQI